jgi:hypothetical protein
MVDLVEAPRDGDRFQERRLPGAVLADEERVGRFAAGGFYSCEGPTGERMNAGNAERPRLPSRRTRASSFIYRNAVRPRGVR